MDAREQLRQRFERALVHWGIQLPVDAMSPGVVCAPTAPVSAIRRMVSATSSGVCP